MTDMVERLARSMAERVIRTNRRHDTDQAELENMMPAAIDYCWPEYVGDARAAIATLREPTHAITRAMAESCATDDEGEFPIMLDLLDFSGENKAHTVLAQAWRDGIDAVLRDL